MGERQAAVEGGALVYTSVSAVKKFQFCPAQWWFRYVARREEKTGPGAEFGTKCHEEVEHYLTNNEPVIGDVPRAALDAGLLPKPKTPGMFVEQSFGENGFTLESESVPFKGFIDLVLPPERGIVRVRDWKFKKDIRKYSTTPTALLDPKDEDGLQMVGYAVALANAVRAGLYPGAEQVQVEHAHIQTQKQEGRYPTALISAKPIQFDSAIELWQSVSSTLRSMKDVAREAAVETVEGNKRACSKYGGCPHREVCPHANAPKPNDRQFRLDALFGSKHKESSMGLLKNLKSPVAPAPAAPSPATAKTPLIVDESTISDAALKAARSAAANPSEVKLAELAVDSADRLGIRPRQQDLNILEAAAVLPPDAPKPAPVTVVLQSPEAIKVAKEAGLVEPEPAVAAPEPKKRRSKKADVVVAPVLSPIPEELRAEIAANERLHERHEAGPKTITTEELLRRIDAEPDGFTLYIGCAPRKTQAKPLQPYVEELEQKALAGFREHLNVDVVDIRLSTGSDVGFGKWKAVLGSLAKENPPPPGAYYVLALGADERADTVVAALEAIATEVVAR